MRDLGDHAARGGRVEDRRAPADPVEAKTDQGLALVVAAPDGAGISPGDTITDIDGRPVRSSRDIEAAIAANATGTVKIRYMIRGAWLTEREAKIR